MDLVKLQQASGKTQEKMARECGITLGQMGNILRGNGIPRADTAGKIATILGKAVQELWPGNPEPSETVEK